MKSMDKVYIRTRQEPSPPSEGGLSPLFTTTRELMCNCGSAELYRIFCGRNDDKYLRRDCHDDHDHGYYEVEGSRYFDLVLQYLADAQKQKQKQKRKRCSSQQQQQQQQQQQLKATDDALDAVFCHRRQREVFKAVYQDAQRYELRGLMAHMLTGLMVWICLVIFICVCVCVYQ